MQKAYSQLKQALRLWYIFCWGKMPNISQYKLHGTAPVLWKMAFLTLIIPLTLQQGFYRVYKGISNSALIPKSVEVNAWNSHLKSVRISWSKPQFLFQLTGNFVFNERNYYEENWAARSCICMWHLISEMNRGDLLIKVFRPDWWHSKVHTFLKHTHKRKLVKIKVWEIAACFFSVIYYFLFVTALPGWFNWSLIRAKLSSWC